MYLFLMEIYIFWGGLLCSIINAVLSTMVAIGYATLVTAFACVCLQIIT